MLLWKRLVEFPTQRANLVLLSYNHNSVQIGLNSQPKVLLSEIQPYKGRAKEALKNVLKKNNRPWAGIFLPKITFKTIHFFVDKQNSASLS